MASIKKIITTTGTSWQIDYYDPEGKRIKKRFPKKAEAEAYLGKAISAIRENRYSEIFETRPHAKTTVADAIRHYIPPYQDQKHFKHFKLPVLRVIEEILGDKLLGELSYLDLETFRKKRQTTITIRHTPRSPAKVNRELAIFKHLLNKAVEWGMLETNPFRQGKSLMLKERNVRQRFLTEDEATRLLEACQPHLRPIVELALHTGMRSGELLGLKWEQVRDGFIYLEGKMTKSGKSRAVPLSDRALEILADLRQAHHLKSPFIWGKRYYTVRKSFAGALRRAGIQDFRFHDLRHTFASNLVRHGVPLRVVQEILGHADAKMTLRYSHLSPGDLRGAIDVLNQPNLLPGKGKDSLSWSSEDKDTGSR